jgi:hypothetical protein
MEMAHYAVRPQSGKSTEQKGGNEHESDDGKE